MKALFIVSVRSERVWLEQIQQLIIIISAFYESADRSIKCAVFNSFKPGVPFMGHRQTK